MTPAELTTARAALGLSREALGVRLGVAGTTIFRWETGRVPVPLAIGLAMKELRRAMMQPFTTTWRDTTTHLAIPAETIEDHDAYPELVCRQHGVPVTLSKVGTSRYATCQQGEGWQDNYQGGWIAR